MFMVSTIFFATAVLGHASTLSNAGISLSDCKDKVGASCDKVDRCIARRVYCLN